MGANLTKKKPEECEASYQKVKKNKGLKPKDDEDQQVIQAVQNLYATAPGCFAKAGDCERAWKVFQDEFPADRFAQIKDPKVRADSLLATFEAMVSKCKK